jgi:competence protein ComEC
VNPRVALVSVGRDNDYGHPAPGTMALWEATGATIGRTDLDGDLAVLGDLSLIRRGVIGE